MTTHAIHARDGRVREVIESGAVAGIIGGAAMVLVAVIYQLSVGADPLTPMAAIAATARGSASVEVSASTVLFGAMIHFFVASIWGIAFAYGVPRTIGGAPAFAFATFTGLCALVLMTWVVLPIVNPATRAHLIWGSSPKSLPVSVAFAMHMVFGGCLALAPWLERRFWIRK